MIIKTDSTCPTLKSGSVKINQLYAATLIHQSIPSMIMKMLVIIGWIQIVKVKPYNSPKLR